MTVTLPSSATDTTVCALADLVPERGAAALVGGAQVALFRIVDAEGDRVYAVSHHDPIGGANVLARGLVGHDGSSWYVASPLLKHRFVLETGRCLDDPETSIPVWSTTVVDGTVHVGGSGPVDR